MSSMALGSMALGSMEWVLWNGFYGFGFLVFIDFTSSSCL